MNTLSSQKPAQSASIPLIVQGVLVYRGDEQDVLKRFVDCCASFSFTGYVARVCGDNPFLQMGLLELLMEEAASGGGGYDYISFSVGGVPAIRTHFGFFCEIVAVGALKRVAATVPGAVFREHVTNYIYERGESFRLRWLEFDRLAPYLGSLMKGTDQAGSLGIDGIDRMVRDIRNLDLAFGEYAIIAEEAVSDARRKLERSIATIRAIEVGESITEADIHLLSPGDVFKWVEKGKVIGRRAKTRIPANEIIYSNLID